jgi:PAS domain-containing protein
MTNPWHHLFFRVSLYLAEENEAFGPVYWLHTSVSYLFIGMGILLYVISFFRTPETIYRKQTLIMILGCLVPLIGNIFYIFRVVPVTVDTTPLLFFVTVVVYGIGIFRFSMLDLRPIAMDTILANIHSGILILDHAGHVVGTNPFFYELFDLRKDVVGSSLNALLQRILPHVRAPEELEKWVRSVYEAPTREAQFSVDLDMQDRAIDLTYSPIFEDHRVPLGGIIVFHDMTEWKTLNRKLERDRVELSKKNEEFLRVNEELRKKNEQLERFNRFAVAREMKMIELKRRLKELEPTE